MNGFSVEPEDLKLCQVAACERVIRSGRYVLGSEVLNFEKNWADLCQANYAVAVANGMDAIEISLRALNISCGDEVITTTMTAFATVLAIIRAGAVPVLADIDLKTANMSLDSAKRCISSKTKAIILVHLYGQISNMDDWLDLVEQENITLIEDCAQSHLAEWKGKKSGTFGRVSAFSFYPTKNLGALGDGGALITSSPEIYSHALSLRNYGQTNRYIHEKLGLNSRMDEIQAAILSERLKYLKSFIERRIQIASEYFEYISNPVIELLKPQFNEHSHVYHLFVIRTNHRDELKKYLDTMQIESFIHYPIPVHKQNITANLMTDPEGLRNAEAHANACLSIPCHPQMTDDEVKYVIKAINAFNI